MAATAAAKAGSRARMMAVRDGPITVWLHTWRKNAPALTARPVSRRAGQTRAEGSCRPSNTAEVARPPTATTASCTAVKGITRCRKATRDRYTMWAA